MGSGKTKIGEKLAKKLDFRFIDLDVYIENKFDKSIIEIFRRNGELEFRNMEKNSLDEILNLENVVVATGGGTACFHDNIEQMNRTGITIYIKTNPGILFSRLTKSKTSRPLIQNKSEKDLTKYISDTLKIREVYYAKAKICLDGKNVKIPELVSQIIRFV